MCVNVFCDPQVLANGQTTVGNGLVVTAGGATVAGSLSAGNFMLGASGGALSVVGAVSVSSTATSVDTLGVYSSASAYTGNALSGRLFPGATTANALVATLGTSLLFQVRGLVCSCPVRLAPSFVFFYCLQVRSNGYVNAAGGLSVGTGATVTTAGLAVAASGMTVAGGLVVRCPSFFVGARTLLSREHVPACFVQVTSSTAATTVAAVTASSASFAGNVIHASSGQAASYTYNIMTLQNSGGTAFAVRCSGVKAALPTLTLSALGGCCM